MKLMEEGVDKGEIEDSLAIKALGSLFTLTEVHFWVDFYTGMPNDLTSLEYTKTGMDDVVSLRTENSSSPIETELTRQMNELGLPLSFTTNKEKRHGKVRGKRKDVHKKILHTHEETTDGVENELQALCGESLQGCGFVNTTDFASNESQMEASSDIHVSGERDTLVLNQRSESEFCSNENTEWPQESDMLLDSTFPNNSNKNNNDTLHGGVNEEFGDWMTYWDDFYARNYYYNIKTHESTWEPPLGMEQPAFDRATTDSKDTFLTSSQMDYNSDADKNYRKEQDSGVLQHDDDPDKRKKKVKQTRAHRRSSNKELQFEESMEKLSPTISKYWCQRYLLFSKYDEGIRMDEEGWFSATPECIAKHHALRCSGGIVVDCFTGVGGNAIHFAPKTSRVIAIDIDPKKIEYAQHNASIYGVEELIEFITGDCFILAKKLKGDTVFLSPPWGGPKYAKARNFDINTMLKPHDGQFLFNVARGIAPRIVMFLPRNVDINQLAELSLSVNPPWKLEVEKNFINDKLKAITAYFTNPSVCNTSSSSCQDSQIGNVVDMISKPCN